MLSAEVLKWLVLVVTGSPLVSGMQLTYEQHSKFPKLFHLDEYHDCLGPKNGVYCLGTFHIRPLRDYEPTYELMKEYSLDLHNFNRTLIHRGYCLSTRCEAFSHIRNTTLRFERCAAEFAKRRSYRSMLTQLNYCRTHAQEYAALEPSVMETPHLVFIYVVLTILMLNVVGTTYDVMVTHDNKSRFLTAWSIKSNWPQVVGPYPSGDPRLAALLPIEGGRVVFIVLVVFVHASCIHESLYLTNPMFAEEMAHHWIAMPLLNGSSTIQLFLVLSSFLLAHSLIGKRQLSFRILPQLIFKRLFRIAPVYLLVLGFAATWWPQMREGPLWLSTVAEEAQVCRRKFWPHVFFLHNFVEPERHCLVPTWFIAVDMQLYVLGCIVTLCLARKKRLALPVLGTAFVASVMFNAYLAYVNHWKPMMFLSGPENLRQLYRNANSFYEFFTHPLGSLPTMIAGLFIAHLHHHLNETGFKMANHKWLLYTCNSMIPLLLLWTTSGHFFRDFRSREFCALFVALERPVSVILGGALIFGAYSSRAKKDHKPVTKAVTSNGTNKPKTGSNSLLMSVFSWRIWYPLGRSSLSVLTLHWCVNMLIKASALQPITSTILDMLSDTLATTFLTYLLAIPLTLIVEIPFTKLHAAITS